MDTDADRLALIEGLGGVLVQTSSGEFQAVFDRQYLGDNVGEVDIESRTPALTCRTSDIDRVGLRKGQLVTVPEGDFKMRRHEPDGTGMSVVILEQG